MPLGLNYEELIIQSNFSSMRFGKGNGNFNAGEIRITFFPNSYEVVSTVSKKQLITFIISF